MEETQAHILVIDDEPAIRRFLRATLAGHGYTLLEAATAQAGIALAAERRPDVILLDLGLPDLDGLDVTTQLREWTSTPIIVLSARGQEHDKVAALEAGADDYLTKPFGVAELMARIKVASKPRCATPPAAPSRPAKASSRSAACASISAVGWCR